MQQMCFYMFRRLLSPFFYADLQVFYLAVRFELFFFSLCVLVLSSIIKMFDNLIFGVIYEDCFGSFRAC